MERESVKTRADELLRAAGSAEPLSPERLEVVWKKTEQAVKAPSSSVPPAAKVGVVVAIVVVGIWLSRSRADQTPSPSRDVALAQPSTAGQADLPPGNQPRPAMDQSRPVVDQTRPAMDPADSAKQGQPTEEAALIAEPSTRSGSANEGSPTGRAVAPSAQPAVTPRAVVPSPRSGSATDRETQRGAATAGSGMDRTNQAEHAALDSPVDEDPILAESRLLREAVVLLRDKADPSAALRVLDTSSARFPAGSLGKEVALVRVEALIAARRRPDALVALQNLTLDDSPRGDELRVLQGELLLEANRLTDARAVFTLALSRPLDAGLRERALYGTALSHEGPQRRTALETYLSTFPKGRFVDAARSELESPR